MTVVQFTRNQTGYTVRFTYNPLLVDALKTTVPSYARQWSADRKQWHLDADWAHPFAATVRDLGGSVIGLGSGTGPPNPDPAQWARLLFHRVGPARRTAVYRALSRCLHPDTETGDKQLQQELNDAHAATETRKETTR